MMSLVKRYRRKLAGAQLQQQQRQVHTPTPQPATSGMSNRSRGTGLWLTALMPAIGSLFLLGCTVISMHSFDRHGSPAVLAH